MKKLLIALLFLPVLLALACTSAPAPSPQPPAEMPDVLSYVPEIPDTESDYPPEPVSEKTAFDYFRDEKLLSGFNIGNSLDAYTPYGVAYEGAWGNPVVNQQLLDGIKAAGFDIVRIPVTWMGKIGPAPDHHINVPYIKRVAEVIGYAHNAGLKVIINLHHDGSTENANKEAGWLSLSKSYEGKLYKDYDDYHAITYKFGRVWLQIAEYFKNYGDWLMFESMNEIHDGGWGWSSNFRGYPQLQFEIINEWNQLFTDAVRSTGGNNESRFLVIPSYCTIPECTYPGGSIKDGAANVGDYFKLPADSTPNRQLITFHYYRPDEVGLGSNGGRSNWGSDADKERIDDDFAPFKGAYIDRNIPVIIGEVGAVRLLYPDDAQKEAQARESRKNYLAYIFATAKKYGLVPIYWDNGNFDKRGERFSLYDRKTGQPNSDESRVLLETMIKAVK